ncbi:hypothetical protein AAFF_G00263110 [Aldrovandia affinis]|uniref:Uncharacterized protein n=1 Tax=Aldrovandia affinis TaxID=143900 RepID=A0AAD7SSV6_9TELE|nr:hypothetical protein AAFF_G00263110 [Aldrovandia affinis]
MRLASEALRGREALPCVVSAGGSNTHSLPDTVAIPRSPDRSYSFYSAVRNVLGEGAQRNPVFQLKSLSPQGFLERRNRSKRHCGDASRTTLVSRLEPNVSPKASAHAHDSGPTAGPMPLCTCRPLGRHCGDASRTTLVSRLEPNVSPKASAHAHDSGPTAGPMPLCTCRPLGRRGPRAPRTHHPQAGHDRSTAIKQCHSPRRPTSDYTACWEFRA